MNINILEGVKFFYLMGAILLLAVSMVVYPALRHRSHR